MNNLHLLTTGVLANDPMIEWAGNHIADSTLVKCFNTDWTVVTSSEDRAHKVVNQVGQSPLDLKVLIDPSARADRDASTMLALRSVPEGEWVWIMPEGAMVDVHCGGELLKMTNSSDSPIAVEKALCRGLDHLIFKRPPDSAIDGAASAGGFFGEMRKRSRNINCSDIYISRGADNDLEKLCVMYWNMKFWKHRYTDFYTRLLSPMRDTKCKMLEIGTAFGGSLRTWRDYMHIGTIVGLDSYGESALNEHEVSSLVGDSSKAEGRAAVEDFVNGSLDFVVDDGDHNPQVQLDTLMNFWPILKTGGSYVVETAHGFEWLVPEIEKAFDNVELEVVNQVSKSGYGDSVLIHVKKNQFM